jgi:hypothetical protein
MGRIPAPTLRLWLLLGLALLVPLLRAGPLRAYEPSQAETRLQLARHFSVYDFEPRPGSLASRDYDGNAWPDYWEAVAEEGMPGYLRSGVRIVTDPARPGLYRGEPGHVLRMPFDGTAVAVQTLVPRQVDAALAYEITFHARTERLAQGIARVVLVWLRVDGPREEELDRDAIRVPPGQVDWPEVPLRLRINDIPAGANAVRVVCEVADDPEVPGGDRHAMVWFDDIRLESRPKVRVEPAFVTATPEERTPPLAVEIRYQGLIDNVPVPGDGQRYRGKEYVREIRITDVNGEPPRGVGGGSLRLGVPPVRRLEPGGARTFVETLALPLERLGVYYVTVNLYGHGRALRARVRQAVGVWQPPRERPPELALGGGGSFGVLLGEPEEQVLRRSGVLSDLVRRLGVFQVKTHAWPADFSPGVEQAYLGALARELREMRVHGVRVTAVLPATPAPFADGGMHQAMRVQAETLEPFLSAATRALGPQVEGWQWGADADTSFSEGVDVEGTRPARTALGNMTASPVQAVPVNVARPRAVVPAAEAARAASFYVPAELPPEMMLRLLAGLRPGAFRPLARPHRYPPAFLRSLAPARESGEEEGEAPAREEAVDQQGWVTVELLPVPRHSRDAAAERAQLDALAVKTVLLSALGFQRLYLGQLAEPAEGLVEIDKEGRPVPRPALLGARVLADHLGGASYLGSFQFRAPFPNYIFQRRSGTEAFCVVWYDGPAVSERLAIEEFGRGLDLRVVDLAGNVRPFRDGTVEVRKTPTIITGLPVPYALTRMSIAIRRAPALRMRHALQPQLVRFRNYFPQQLPGAFRFQYAARRILHPEERRPVLEFERNWTVRPERVEFNLAMAEEDVPTPGTVEIRVRPDPATSLDLEPEIARERGEKVIQILADFSTGLPVQARILRTTYLESELQVEVIRLRRPGDTERAHLQLQVRWFPSEDAAGQAAVELEPYWQRDGELRTRLPQVTVPPFSRNRPNEPAIPREVVIPLRPGAPKATWIGLEEVGGSRFYRLEVTPLLQAAPPGEGGP